MNSMAIILISAALFFAFVLWIASDTDHLEKWTGLTFTAAIIGGLVIYGSINANTYRAAPFIAVLRTVVDLGKMFGNSGAEGYDNFMGIFTGASAGSVKLLTFFYWIIHFFAYYSMISAVIMLLGKGVLQKVRTILMRVRDIELIYGVDDRTLEFGSKLSKNRGISIVYVGNGNVPETSIRRMGALWYNDSDAMEPREAFVKRLNIKKGKCNLRLSALSEDADANLTYARKLIDCLKELGIEPEQTQLVILGLEDMDGSDLQALGDHYGYGSVRMFDRAELISRLLIKNYPLCDTVRFDKDAKAMDDVEILIIGFGSIGRQILRKTVAGGQFHGSAFHAAVFDPMIGKDDGFFRNRYAPMLEEYDIDLMPYGGLSSELISYVIKKGEKLSYIVIATGDEKTGREIVGGVMDTLKRLGINKPVYQACRDRVVYYHGTDPIRTYLSYETDILHQGLIDELAVEINHYYWGESEPADEQWKQCDYFSRMSCRASADYLSSLLKRTDTLEKETLSPAETENLGISEHRRWNAFHFSMGYSRMSREICEERAELYRKDNSVRITKDALKKQHACLISWDELDELSEWENAVTGKSIDYKQMDRNNVDVIRKIVRENIEKSKKNPEPAEGAEQILRRYIPAIGLIVVAVVIGIVILLEEG